MRHYLESDCGKLRALVRRAQGVVEWLLRPRCCMTSVAAGTSAAWQSYWDLLGIICCGI